MSKVELDIREFLSHLVLRGPITSGKTNSLSHGSGQFSDFLRQQQHGVLRGLFRVSARFSCA